MASIYDSFSKQRVRTKGPLTIKESTCKAINGVGTIPDLTVLPLLFNKD